MHRRPQSVDERGRAGMIVCMQGRLHLVGDPEVVEEGKRVASFKHWYLPGVRVGHSPRLRARYGSNAIS